MRVTRKQFPLVFERHDSLDAQEWANGFDVDDAKFGQYRAEIERTGRHLSAEERDCWAIYSAHRHIIAAPQPSEPLSGMHRLSLAINNQNRELGALRRNLEDRHTYLWAWRIAVLIFLFLILVLHVHAQDEAGPWYYPNVISADQFVRGIILRPSTFPQIQSRITTIQFLNGSAVRIAIFAAPFSIECGANIICTQNGSILTMTSSGGGGSGCVPPGAANNLLYDDGAGNCDDLGVLGTTSTLLHGNAAGLPSFGKVVSTDLNITGTTCTNQVLTILSSSAAGTCTTVTSAYVDTSIGQTGVDMNTSFQITATHIASSTNTDIAIFNSTGNLVNYGGASSCTNQFFTGLSAAGASTCTTATAASAQFANQGTTTTLLHGNASGNPSWSAVSLPNDTTGQLPIGAVGSGGLSGNSPISIASTGAISCSTCNTSSATVSSVATTSPITGGTITTTGTIACGTCATTTNGGALSGTAPVAISAAGAISITGAAGQVLAGASPAFTATPALGTDNSVAGTLTLANSAASAHTIWSSGATTTNTIAGFATAPTTKDGVMCTTSSTTCILTDTGIVNPSASGSAIYAMEVCATTLSLGTTLISSASKTALTATCTGLASTDQVIATFASDPTATTGYIPSTSGMLTIVTWPTTNTINVDVVNNTSSSITPGGALTLNLVGLHHGT